METFNFLEAEITQSNLVSFSEEKVNLGRDQAQKYRDQVNNLRDHLDRYINEHPDVGLVKMLLSGSLSKGLALRVINDVDVALYVKGDAAPNEIGELLEWIAKKLRETYHQMGFDQILVDGPCVVIKYASGFKIEVTPILYEGDPKMRGYLWDKSTRKKILTSIPMHRDFTQKRKDAQPIAYAQIIRLIKWWVRQRKQDNPGFTLRSFLIELIMAKLCDDGSDFTDYHLGLEHFFLYIQKSGLKERIAFEDNYTTSALPKTSTDVVEIFDPVTPDNNVAYDITDVDRKKLIELADVALDTLSWAKTCQTKTQALECWQELMGAGFNA